MIYNMKCRINLVLFLLIVLICSCEDNVESTLICDVNQLEFSYTGGEKTIKIESNADWSIYEVPDWLTVSIYSGINSQDVTFTVEPNMTGLDRQGEISIRSNDSKKICTLSILQFASSEGRILQIDNSDTKYFNGNTSFEFEDSIMINSSIRWTIKGPSWLNARFGTTPTEMNGEFREGSGVLYLRANVQYVGDESLKDTKYIQSEIGDIVHKIPVVQMGAEEVKCFKVLALTNGMAFKVKTGSKVLSFTYNAFKGNKSVNEMAGEDYLSWPSSGLMLYNPIIYVSGLEPDTDYTLMMRTFIYNKINDKTFCSCTFHTPSSASQPRAIVQNLKRQQYAYGNAYSWNFDVKMNDVAKGYYCLTLNEGWYGKPDIEIAYSIYQEIKKGEYHLFTQDEALSTQGDSSGIVILTWAVDEKGNLSNVLDKKSFGVLY